MPRQTLLIFAQCPVPEFITRLSFGLLRKEGTQRVDLGSFTQPPLNLTGGGEVHLLLVLSFLQHVLSAGHRCTGAGLAGALQARHIDRRRTQLSDVLGSRGREVIQDLWGSSREQSLESLMFYP